MRRAMVRKFVNKIVLALPFVLVTAMLPALPAAVAAPGAQDVLPIGVTYPNPMPSPKNASAHLAASGKPLDSRFTAPAKQCATTPAAYGMSRAAGKAGDERSQPRRQPSAQQSCGSARTVEADRGYRRSTDKGKQATPSPDWTPAAGSPAARYGAATVYDAARQRVLVFGGADTETDTVHASTWTWNGTGWTDLTGPLHTAPSARAFAQVAYDPIRRQVVLFGGAAPGGAAALGDTWTWDGSAWTEHTPATVPPARSQAAIAWDPDLGRILLYGGIGTDHRVLGDSWTWDGTTWAPLRPQVAPGPLAASAMAYDDAHHTLLLFGGTADATGQAAANDVTWSFDGRTWRRPNPATKPAGRAGAGMVYDAALGRIVLTMGATLGGRDRDLNDTWTWNGSTWSRLAGIASPAARQDAGLAYDTATRQAVLVGGGFGAGGRRGAVTFSDTSLITLSAPTLTETVDKGAGGIYSSGGTASYTLTVGNSGLLSGLAVTITDQLPASMALASAPVSILDVGTGLSIGCGGGVAVCAIANNKLTITGLAIGVLDSFQVSFSPVVAGLGRACSTATDNAIASSLLGGTSAISIPITICDTGLGLENWWTFVNQDVGPQARASVNVSNGNLVVQQSDTTPVQAHGHLAYGLTRTYNSQDTTLLALPGSFGAGWQLNIDQTGDLAGLGLGATSLFVPPLASVLNPLAVTLIDQDGTRHVFQFRGLNTTIDITGLLGGGSGPLADLVPQALSLDTSKFNHLCVDETFTSPAGVHLGLYRYIEVHSGNTITPCSVPDPGTSPVVLGWATVSPQRVRHEFSFDGHLLDVRDSSGTDLRYQYAAQPLAGVTLGPLQTIFEPRSCTLPLASTCRAFRFSYSAGETDVTDPAGRLTRYQFDNTPLTPRLVKVINPDGSQISYAYQANAFSGVNCGGSANSLCSITDPRGNTTHYSYQTPLIGLAKLTSMTDRRGTTTSFTYHTSPDFVTADIAGHRARFQGIDDSGRVAEIDQGDTSDAYPHQTLDTWDTAAATCQQPDQTVNNNLCRQVVKSLTTQTPDQDMTYVYNPEGQLLHQHWASPALDATAGFHAQYFQADGSVRTFDDTVQGSGQVRSDGPATGRGDAGTLFAVSDPTQALTPRGNAAGTGFAPFLTTDKVDDNPNAMPNAIPASDPCANPDAPTSNTGDLCETDAPSFDGGAHPTVTRYTYDTFGARLTMATPKAIAETPGGQPVATYTYTYYQDSELDLSGSVSAGGWLKGITDPTGNFVAFGYDRAGNVVRTWDRNATQGHHLADFPGSVTAPPSPAYTESLYATGATAYSAPWRYMRSQRDQVGDLTTFTVDPNGNQTTIRPTRGNQAGNANFDITQTFDADNNQLTSLLPLEAGANKATTYGYDPFNNRTSITDPDGNVTTSQYDSANRQVGTAFTRGPFPSDTSQVPPACRQSTSADAPIPAGRVLCSAATSYDGIDNRLSSTDANHQVTTYTYDGVKRRISQLVPRNDGALTALRTDTVYDQDGNVTDVCPPREFADGGSTSCTSSGFYSQHRSFDVAGRMVVQTTFRTVGGQPNTTTVTYDADGNPSSSTDANKHTTTTGYDLLDRSTSVTVPRDSTTTNTTATNYDPTGNVTSVVRPGNLITAYSYDAADRRIDTVQGADNVSAAAAGLPDANGGSNIRTRVVYNADSQPVARFTPSAFASSTTNPDASFMVRVDIDQDGRTAAVFQPRYDSGTHSDPGLSPTQTVQCTTTPSPQALQGVPGFPAGVGVCVTHYQYDPAGRHTRTVLPTSNGSDNRFVDYTYTDDGLTAGVSTPSPAKDGIRVTSASYLYDGNGKQVKQTDALGHQATTSYTADELVAQQALQPNGSVTHVTTNTYDANGNPITTVDAAGNKPATTDYYADNLTKDVIDPLGDTTSYVYDPVGNLIQKFSPSAVAKDPTNQQGVPVTNTYTFDNLPLTFSQAVTPGNTPDIQRTTWGYDAAGRKISEDITDFTNHGPQDPGPQFFAYYNNDRISKETGRTRETVNHSYDPNGNETAITDSTSGGSTISSTFYLDNQDRTVDDGSRTSQYSYDGQGQQAALATQVDGSTNKTTTTYTYGEAEQATAMSSTIVGATNNTTTFSYDDAGRLATEQDPNGQHVTVSFNPDDTLASKSLTNSTSGSVASFAYTYDNNFQITSQTFTGQGGKQGKQTYTYDAAGRLASFTDGTNPTQQVKFDHDGNRISVGTNTGTSSYNPDDTLATITDPSGTVHPQIYSFRGDLQDDGCFLYTYDGLDRMTNVIPKNTAGCPSTPGTTYTYDGLGRQRTTGSTTLHYDGTSSLVSAVTSASGTDTAYELSPDGQAKAVAATGGTPQYLSDDGKGNITTVTDTSSGLACSVRYDPWGSPLGAQSQGNPCDTGATINDHFYRGQRLDPVTGNYQLGNRAYSPGKASFINPDTYRLSQPGQDLNAQSDPLTQNRYAYVNGDPVNLQDPNGHCSWSAAPWDKGSCFNPQQIQHGAQQLVHNVQQGLQSAKQGVSNLVQSGQQAIGNAQNTVDNKARSVSQAVSEGWYATTQWVGQHKADIAGIGAAIAVGAACEVATAGAGTIGCAVLAGAVGSAVQYSISASENHTFSVGGLALATGIGALTGLAGGVGGRLAATVGGRLLETEAGQALAGGAQRLLGKAAGAVESGAQRLLGRGATEVEEEAGGSSLAETCAINSFAGTTPVLMADGKEKPIKDIKVGDRVKATDPQAGQTRSELVQRVIVGKGLKHLVDVSLPGEKIEATYNHPFWVVEDQKFEWATDLRTGEHLLLASGTTTPVLSLSRHDEVTTVYNLSIKQIHTFYVGPIGTLVHNMCANPGTPTSNPIAVIGRKPDVEIAQDWPGHVVFTPTEPYTWEENEAWANDVIEKKMTAYMASPMTWENIWDKGAKVARPFFKEYKLFERAGYRWSGSYPLPPEE